MSATPPSLPVEMLGGESFLVSLANGLPARGLEGFPVVAAVSGGADSVAMLLGLVRLGTPGLVVAHAEHDLRPDAPADRAFVGKLAERLGLPWTWRRLAVRARAGERTGEGLEARARRLRYGFLAEVARDFGARHVLVAHTADDQAETILHRILRGTGVAGLAGMRRARELCEGVALVRPLLGVARETGRAFLRDTGEEWREDATNDDTARARNFLRHDVLPRCSSGPYPAAAASLTRLGGQAATVAAAITSAAEHLLGLYASEQADGGVLLRTEQLAGLDPHLIAEVFAVLWRREGWPQRDMTARHYQALVRVVSHAIMPSGSPVARLPTQFPGNVTATPFGRGRIVLVRR